MVGRLRAVLSILGLALPIAAPALAQQGTLEKIGQSGVLTIGTRTASPPFAFVNKQNEWVGFSIDLVEQAVKPAIERKLGDRKSTRLNSSHLVISYAVFCLKKK